MLQRVSARILPLRRVGRSEGTAPSLRQAVRGGVLLCALSHYNYWFLAVRSDIKCERGDDSAVKGSRLSASADPGLTMKRLLEEAGIDLQRDNVRIVPSPRRTSPNWAWDGVDAIEQGVSDGY
jgi:NitT/TauT family transport system substrate-binding protein